MVDFHTHILPQMDDGSGSVEESVGMLARLAAQGVDTVALTSHYYAREESPASFLERRQKALLRLQPALAQGGFPALRLGAEVYYFHGFGRIEQLPELRMEGSRVLLLEMPFCTWSEAELGEIIDLCGDPSFVILLAHVERYVKYQKAAVWDRLVSAGVMMQSNADFFLHPRTRRKAARMVREGRIHVLGTDCHNMHARSPRMAEALAVLERELGPGAARRFAQRSEEYLEEWSL